MSEIKVNKISPRSGTEVTLGDSGDTFTIPAGVSISNSGTASGFGSTGEVSWNTTVKTSTFTVVAGEGYFCNTTGGAFTANLPAGTAGSSFAIADYAATFQTNNLTVSPNGSQKIGGTNADVALSTEGQSAYFVYIDDTQGWINVIDSTSNVRGASFVVATGGTITTCGNDKIHTFTGPGTFTVCSVSSLPANNEVSYLVVAGGGGGGDGNNGPNRNGGGGGGAGGFREVKSPVTSYTASPLDGQPSAPNRITVTAQGYPITVGGGGGGAYSANPGDNSVFSTITSAGGGGGTSDESGAGGGKNGGSGGGSGNNGSPGSSGPVVPGGSGNTPPVSPPQGNDGSQSPSAHGGGGGGANNAATNTINGAAGSTTSITGSPVTRAGGGGAGSPPGEGGGGSGGPGGGGAGGEESPGPGGDGAAGTVNTGGGGGGSDSGPSGTRTGGNGGSGIVVIRYKFQ